MSHFLKIFRCFTKSRQARRYLNRMISEAPSSERLAANNLLGITYFNQHRLTDAVATFKRTIAMDPQSMEALWSMKLLSSLYKTMGLKSERFSIDMQRLTTLKRLLHSSNDAEKIRFAYNELLQEYDDRGLVRSASQSTTADMDAILGLNLSTDRDS